MLDRLAAELFTASALAALLQVVMIDLVLAADNAVVIGLAAAALPPAQRTRAIMIGIAVATALRIVLAFVATELLHVVGLPLAGGLLLLFVCWKLWRELRRPPDHASPSEASIERDQAAPPRGDAPPGAEVPQRSTFARAAWRIVVADVSMSLDNVLAIAGAAREHPTVLVLGLALSIALMALAANLIVRLLDRYRWIAYAGLAVIVYVSLEMIYRGGLQVWSAG
jgi:YjbE family integral membrane protein